MPVALPVTAQSMNYASVVFAGFATISVIWYFVRGRKSFTGPPVGADVSPDEVGVIAGTTMDGSDTEKPRSVEAVEKVASPEEAAVKEVS